MHLTAYSASASATMHQMCLWLSFFHTLHLVLCALQAGKEPQAAARCWTFHQPPFPSSWCLAAPPSYLSLYTPGPPTCPHISFPWHAPPSLAPPPPPCASVFMLCVERSCISIVKVCCCRSQVTSCTCLHLAGRHCISGCLHDSAVVPSCGASARIHEGIGCCWRVLPVSQHNWPLICLCWQRLCAADSTSVRAACMNAGGALRGRRELFASRGVHGGGGAFHRRISDCE